MSDRVWQLQDIKLGGPDFPEQVVVSLPAPVTGEVEAEMTVRRRMHNLFINQSPVEGVQIIDGSGAIVARWTKWDELQASECGEPSDVQGTQNGLTSKK